MTYKDLSSHNGGVTLRWNAFRAPLVICQVTQTILNLNLRQYETTSHVVINQYLRKALVPSHHLHISA